MNASISSRMACISSMNFLFSYSSDINLPHVASVDVVSCVVDVHLFQWLKRCAVEYNVLRRPVTTFDNVGILISLVLAAVHASGIVAAFHGRNDLGHSGIQVDQRDQPITANGVEVAPIR